MTRILFFLTICEALLFGAPVEKAKSVSVSVHKLPLPTYKMGPDERQPIFRGFRVPRMVSFRSDRSTYPYPRADNFSYQKEVVEYDAITLENEYIKVVVLPGLRGRVQGAIDKRNGWEFLYFNHVIKPGDIAVRAGWLAGGLEWNHPGGHGYTQFSRISHKIIENADGSKTVLVAEIEPVRMMKWETAITLRPGSLALETEGRFYSIAPHPVPFASSLNAAMHAGDDMEMIYPEGTYITGHGKRYVKPWPVYDGVDHRWFRNLEASYSIFSEGGADDFFGCYSHAKNAGTAVVADHRTAPGRKYFSWGASPAGRRWDTLLSDTDGPYVELQVGAFWDNLGYGYAWLDPMEVKKYTVYWYPLKDLRGFVKANEHIALNCKREGSSHVALGVQAVRRHRGAKLSVTAAGRRLLARNVDLDPARPLLDRIELPANVPYHELLVEISSLEGGRLIAYQPLREHPPAPETAPSRKPLNQLSLDELYNWGKSFYQDPFGSEAEEYFVEMLRRDPMESRANRELGLMAYHRGQWAKAKEYLARSLKNDPLNEGFLARHYLGLTALAEGDLAEAKKHLTVSSRVARLKHSALYHLAESEMRSGRHREAAALLNEAIQSGGIHPALHAALAFAYRKSGQAELAGTFRKQALERDPLEFLALLEQWQSGEIKEPDIHAQFDRKDPSFVGSQLYIEGAARYGAFGDWETAAKLLQAGIRYFESRGEGYAMLDYYLGYCYEKLDRVDLVKPQLAAASRRGSDYVFPYRPLDLAVLQAALRKQPPDALGWMYLGEGLFYLRRYAEANQAWERSLKENPRNARALRNLANGYWTVSNDLKRTVALMEKAFEADTSDARVFLEYEHFLDADRQFDKRRELFAKHEALVLRNDELVQRYVWLLLRDRQYEKAASVVGQTRFFARERASQIHGAYAEAHYGTGEKLLASGKPGEAMKHFQAATEYPDNLASGAPARRVLARFHYLMGMAHEALGAADAAREEWSKAAGEAVAPASEGVVYQALALRKLDRRAEAEVLLKQLVEECSKTPAGRRTQGNRKYVISLALRALGRAEEADTYLREALEDNPDAVLQSAIDAARSPALPES